MAETELQVTQLAFPRVLAATPGLCFAAPGEQQEIQLGGAVTVGAFHSDDKRHFGSPEGG